MPEESAETKGRTWDGQPISAEPPYGAVIVVSRDGSRGETEFLLLHRAHYVPDDQGDWAWGPPSGCRHPDEPIERCAERELFEETGLRLSLRRIDTAATDWPVFQGTAPRDAPIGLSAEHDRASWLPADPALALVAPEVVRTQLRLAVGILGASRARRLCRDGPPAPRSGPRKL